MESKQTFSFEAHQVQDVLLVKLSGRLTIGRVDELDVFLRSLVDRPEQKYLLDFSDLTHIVSSGIGAIIAFRERVVRSQGRLAVGGLNPRIMKIFQLMSLECFFPIHESADEAFQTLRKASD